MNEELECWRHECIVCRNIWFSWKRKDPCPKCGNKWSNMHDKLPSEVCKEKVKS